MLSNDTFTYTNSYQSIYNHTTNISKLFHSNSILFFYDINRDNFAYDLNMNRLAHLPAQFTGINFKAVNIIDNYFYFMMTSNFFITTYDPITQSFSILSVQSNLPTFSSNLKVNLTTN